MRGILSVHWLSYSKNLFFSLQKYYNNLIVLVKHTYRSIRDTQNYIINLYFLWILHIIRHLFMDLQMRVIRIK
jgi:hypothetical protein